MSFIKVFYRHALGNKVFSIITISSLAISLSIVIILLAFLVSELKYDKHIEDIERIFRIGDSKGEAKIPEKAKDQIIEQLPEVVSATNYAVYPDPVIYNGQIFNTPVIHTDENFFDIFNIEFITGQSKGIFNDPNNVIITESLSKKVFGSENPIGKIINIAHKSNVQVAAIISDFPKQSILTGDVICSTKLRIRYTRTFGNNYSFFSYNVLLKLDNKPITDNFSKKLTEIISSTTLNMAEDLTYTLFRYKGAYFDTSLNNDGLKHANINLIHLLVFLTSILLGLSIFNFINLTLSQISTRNKEFGIKQILGANYIRIFIQFLKESFFIIMLAFSIGILLSYTFKPAFDNMLGEEIFIKELIASPSILVICLLCLLILACISAIYPAFATLKFKPREIIQGNDKKSSHSINFRSILNILQYASSVAVIIGLIVITKQIKYAKNKDLGFTTEQLVMIPIHKNAKDKIDVLKNMLQSIVGIKNVCSSRGIPGKIMSGSTTPNFGHLSIITSDCDFVKTFDLKIDQGRNIYPNEKGKVCLINQKAFQQFGWEDFRGKKVLNAEVIGLIDNFHFKDLYHQIGGLMIENGKDVSHLTIRFYPGNVANVMEQVEKGFKEVLNDFEFSYQFYDDYFDSLYRQEEKRASAIKIIALIVIFITCIGIFGSVEFSTQNKIQEIGIRKINGASVFEIILLLSKDFIRLFIVAFIISCPIAYYILIEWLNAFKYRISLSWWIFLLAGFSMIIVALLTMSWRTWKAASSNPVYALRYE